MKPHELAFLNHLRVMDPSAFRGHTSKEPRSDETTLAEYKRDILKDWTAGVRWGAEHQDIEPEELVSISAPRRSPMLDSPWTNGGSRGYGHDYL